MSRARLRFLQLSLLVASVLGLLASAPRLAAEPVWLVSNGFHSSLGLRVRDLPAWLTPRGTPPANYLLIGWGDANWYRGHVNFGTFCSAVFWPTPSVFHVVPVRHEIAQEFAHSDVLRLDLAPGDFAKLRGGLERSFARTAQGQPISAGGGFLPGSRFFYSRESFYFPKMCNYWVAEQLQKSGLHLSRFRGVAAGWLVGEAAPLGTREAWRHGAKNYF